MVRVCGIILNAPRQKEATDNQGSRMEYKKGGSVSRAAPQPNHLKQRKKSKLCRNATPCGFYLPAGIVPEIAPGIHR